MGLLPQLNFPEGGVAPNHAQRVGYPAYQLFNYSRQLRAMFEHNSPLLATYIDSVM